MAIGGIPLRFGLRHPGLGLRQTGVRRLIRSFLAVVFRFSNQGVLIQTLRPSPIELGAFEVGFRAVQVGRRGIQRGVGGDRIRLRCLE